MLTVDSAVGRQLVHRARQLLLDVDAVASRLGLPRVTLEQLVRGELPVTVDLAATMAEVLGWDVEYWLELDGERRHRAWLAVLGDFAPETLRELRRRGWIGATKKQPETLARELSDFFGCDPGDAVSLPASFRQSQAHPVRDDALSVWLRLADHQTRRAAELRDVGPLDPAALRSRLPELVRKGTAPPAEYLAGVVDALADVGVVVVFQPAVPGTRLSGASWPMASGPGAVALTLRHATDDFFWWTLFHECAHLLLGHGAVVDTGPGQPDDDEAQADALARTLLMPERWTLGPGRASREVVGRAARDLGIPPGVLVGQLQHSGRVRPQDLNGVKHVMPTPESLEVMATLPRPQGAAWEEAVAGLVAVSSTRR